VLHVSKNGLARPADEPMSTRDIGTTVQTTGHSENGLCYTEPVEESKEEERTTKHKPANWPTPGGSDTQL